MGTPASPRSAIAPASAAHAHAPRLRPRPAARKLAASSTNPSATSGGIAG
jgi:hypothetical protein